jgi:hypothetical protein
MPLRSLYKMGSYDLHYCVLLLRPIATIGSPELSDMAYGIRRLIYIYISWLGVFIDIPDLRGTSNST